MTSARRCLIGAGSSGITTAQVLQARGVDFDCFGASSGLGGNWRYDNDNQMSSAYESLHINTSRRMMQYAAHPMSDPVPDYPATGGSRPTSTSSWTTSTCARRSPSAPR